MDIISRCIAMNRHISSIDEINNQTWEVFNNSIKEKEIILFGMGKGLNYFCNNYSDIYNISAIIDNDLRKDGLNVKYGQKEITVHHSIFLNTITKDTVFLITSLLYYEDIYFQLTELGFEPFVFLVMESKLPKFLNIDAINYNYINNFSNLPIVENKVFFYDSYGYVGHARSIIESLIKSNTNLQIVCSTKNLNEQVPKQIKLISTDNESEVDYHFATSKICLSDYLIPKHITKKSNQFFILYKHWSITVKSVGYVLAKHQNNYFMMNSFCENAQKLDFIFSECEFDEACLKKCFLFDKDFIRVGSPRSDLLFRFNKQSNKNYICDHLNIKRDTKILLYAPTFRLDHNLRHKKESDYVFDKFNLLLSKLKIKFGEHWTVLLRYHPSSKSFVDQTNESIINVTNFNEVQELIAISDIVMTDYSSLMFEAAFLKKPVFLYVPDKQTYIGGERELLIDLDSLPFPLATNTDDLFYEIDNFNILSYENDVDKFLQNYNIHEDGNASKKAADFIFHLLKKQIN